MRMQTKLVAASLVIVLGAHAVTAGASSIDARQRNQESRIAEGVQSGELTRRETNRLIQGQAELQRLENRVRRDGVVTNRERARLHNKANVESRRIQRSKNNDPQIRGA